MNHDRVVDGLGAFSVVGDVVRNGVVYSAKNVAGDVSRETTGLVTRVAFLLFGSIMMPLPKRLITYI